MDGKTLGSELAAPHNERSADGSHWQSHAGLTKRELFAAMAMQGMLSMLSDPQIAQAMNKTANRKCLDPDVYLARESVSFADHLLAALSEPQA